MFTTTKIETGLDLTVKPIKNNSKDSIKQPKLAQENVVPKLLTSSLIVGRSGSGKSILMNFMLNNENIYENWFDCVILVSPTCNTDDVQAAFGADECVDDLDQADEFLSNLMNIQKKKIEEYGAENAPKVCIVFDDVIGHKFLYSSSFTGCFTRCRHYNFTVFALSQQYKAIPKKCRLQVNNLMFFKSSDTETQSVVDDYCPPNYSKLKFLKVIQGANNDDHSFLYINMKEPFKNRYRKNFDEIIQI